MISPNKFFILTTLVLSIFSNGAAAQSEQPNGAKTISGGVVNGKATSLVRPSYPKAAKDARVGGAVNVQVTIDEEGSVISAKAVSGHPLLVEVSEQAARASKFAPTTLAGQPVKVIGVIVYNFVLPMPYLEIGYELALAQKNPTPEDFPMASLSGTLPRAWEEEQAYLKRLEAFRVEKPADEKKDEPQQTEPGKALTKPEKTAANEAVFDTGKSLYRAEPLRSSSGTFVRSEFIVNNKNAEAVEILKNLQTKLETRLSPNARIQWYFRAGMILGSLAAEIDRAEPRRARLDELNLLLNNIPFGISEASVKQMREVAAFSQLSAFDAKNRDELLALLKELRYARFE